MSDVDPDRFSRSSGPAPAEGESGRAPAGTAPGSPSVTGPGQAANEPPLLEGRDLVHVLGGRRVVDVESIEVRRGEAVALLGPNGAGKTTLMSLLAGLGPADAGAVLYRGRTIGPDDPELRRSLAAVLQRPYLWRGTVAWNVEFGLRARGVPADERSDRAAEALGALGIADLADAPVETLSGGEAQRVALARALAVEPEILFLDEPTADLDVSVRRRLLEDLERIVRRRSGAVVVITHDPGEAFTLADRVAVMEDGRIVQEGTPADVYEAPATGFVASFTGAEFLLPGRVETGAQGLLWVRLDSGQTVVAPGAFGPGARVTVAYRPEDVVLAPVGEAADPGEPSPAANGENSEPTRTPAAGPADTAGPRPAAGPSGAVDPRSGGAERTSARNRFRVRVARVHPLGGLVRLRLEGDGMELVAVVTRQALDELELEPGTPVEARIKATALHAFRV